MPQPKEEWVRFALHTMGLEQSDPAIDMLMRAPLNPDIDPIASILEAITFQLRTYGRLIDFYPEEGPECNQ